MQSIITGSCRSSTTRIRSIKMLKVGFSGFGTELKICKLAIGRVYLNVLLVCHNDVGRVKNELVGLLHLAFNQTHCQGLLQLVHDRRLLHILNGFQLLSDLLVFLP